MALLSLQVQGVPCGEDDLVLACMALRRAYVADTAVAMIVVEAQAVQRARAEWEERCRAATADRHGLQAELDTARTHLAAAADRQADLHKQLERTQDQLAQALKQLEIKDREHGALLQALVDQAARKPPKPRPTRSG